MLISPLSWLQLSKTRSERDSYMAQLSELQLELDRERTENARRLDELNMQIEALMASLRELMDCKMSLELEISCYKKLLEGEENRSGPARVALPVVVKTSVILSCCRVVGTAYPGRVDCTKWGTVQVHLSSVLFCFYFEFFSITCICSQMFILYHRKCYNLFFF